ncbi:hypothetical protein GJ496_007824 [Pomphorhynchus laevis]|nr:hypothetical protein GJ496_007824 [Pomphorhynchus laevis]
MSIIKDLYFEQTNLVVDATCDLSLADDKMMKLNDNFHESIKKRIWMINGSKHNPNVMADWMRTMITKVAGPQFELAIDLAMGRRDALLSSAEQIEKLNIQNIKDKAVTMKP